MIEMLMEKDNSWRTRFRKWRNDVARIYTASEVGQILSRIESGYRRGFRSTVYENLDLDVIDSLVNQPAPYKMLKAYAKGHPFLRMIHGVIIRGVMKNGYGSKPNFAKKCTNCGAEYQRPVESCKECGGTSVGGCERVSLRSSRRRTGQRSPL